MKGSEMHAGGNRRFRLFLLVALAASVLPVGVRAEPWHGRWSPNLAWCFQAEAILPEALLRLGGAQASFGIETCRIEEASDVVAGKRWRLRLLCGSDEPKTIEVEVDDDVLLLFTGAAGSPPKRYVRCPEAG